MGYFQKYFHQFCTKVGALFYHFGQIYTNFLVVHKGIIFTTKLTSAEVTTQSFWGCFFVVVAVVNIVVVVLSFVAVHIGFSFGQSKFNYHFLRLMILFFYRFFVVVVDIFVIIVVNVVIVALLVVTDHIIFCCGCPEG